MSCVTVIVNIYIIKLPEKGLFSQPRPAFPFVQSGQKAGSITMWPLCGQGSMFSNLEKCAGIRSGNKLSGPSGMVDEGQ